MTAMHVKLSLLLTLVVAPVTAQELGVFGPTESGNYACWKRDYDAAHLASHPDQLVTNMSLVVDFPTEAEAREFSSFYDFSLDATLRGGKSGNGSGTCTPSGDGTGMVCGIDCDGGGVAVGIRDDGSVLVDLEHYGYIRLDGECAGGDEADTFPLEAGVDDKTFLLHPVTGKACRNIAPDWMR
ncbi:MAG: hypothetical protein KIT02_00875 [Devosia sp.]|uniref:hypothetical protein n=1 Tax=Devosia sp. TaxID=1871048 RepID=UPI0024C5AF85|nr:hypothetical protein [Devosia sp.]UYN99828.1 MAG: hypothetical protein KIT02_00875 [Devosia sp.]